MSRFITGDELGNIKVIKYSADAEPKTELKTVHDGSATGKLKTVQRLAIASTSNGPKLVRPLYQAIARLLTMLFKGSLLQHSLMDLFPLPHCTRMIALNR